MVLKSEEMAATRRVAVLGALAALGLSACSAARVVGDDKQSKLRRPQTLWPAPPEQPRFEYQATLRSAADIVRENDEMKWEKMLIGRAVSDNPVIYKPSGIASRGGMIYLTEPVAKCVTVFDVPRRKLFRFGLREPNKLERPMGIALDDKRHAYVVDAGLRRVMVFDGLGLFSHSIDIDRGFTSPVALAVSPNGDTVYVVDRGDIANEDHKIVAFGQDGKERFRLGPRGPEPGKFNIPLAAVTGPDGALYVCDSGNFRVQKFDSSGKFLVSFGGVGAELGRFSRPRSIALDPQGNIYVSDAGFGNVQIFNPQGELLLAIGKLGQVSGPGNYRLIAGIAVDEGGRLYVVDHFVKKVEVFARLSEEDGKRRMLMQD